MVESEYIKVSTKFETPVIFKKHGTGWLFFDNSSGITYGSRVLQKKELVAVVEKFSIHPDVLHSISGDVKKMKVEKSEDVSEFFVERLVGREDQVAAMYRILGGESYGLSKKDVLNFAIANKFFLSANINYILELVYVDFGTFIDETGHIKETGTLFGVEAELLNARNFIIRDTREALIFFKFATSHTEFLKKLKKTSVKFSSGVDFLSVNEKYSCTLYSIVLPDDFDSALPHTNVSSKYLTFGSKFRTGGFMLHNSLRGVKFTGEFPELCLVSKRELKEASELPVYGYNYRNFCIGIPSSIQAIYLPDSGISKLPFKKRLPYLTRLHIGNTPRLGYDESNLENVTEFKSSIPPETIPVEKLILTSNLYNLKVALFPLREHIFAAKPVMDFLTSLVLEGEFNAPLLDLRGAKVLTDVVAGDSFTGSIKFPPKLERLKTGKLYTGFGLKTTYYISDKFYEDNVKGLVYAADFNALPKSIKKIVLNSPVIKKVREFLFDFKNYPDLEFASLSGEVIIGKWGVNPNLNRN